MKLSRIALTVSCLALFACKNDPEPVQPVGVYIPPAPIIEYKVVDTLPHDVNAFTEGLLVHNGKMFESTGSPENLPNAKSYFGVVDPATGIVNSKQELAPQFFGEGIVIFKDKLYQLTYRSQLGFVYDLKTMKKIKEFSFINAEGWGMTTDSTSLIMSDGTSSLSYLDPETLTLKKTLNVTENGNNFPNINELEYINGYIYANVWTTNTIVKIDPKDGKVLGRIDLHELVKAAMAKNPASEEMNGIAWDAAKDKIYVTGKMWPSMFEISFPH